MSDIEKKNKESIRLGKKPVWEMSYKELLISIPKRLIALPAKLIGLKGLVLTVATVLFLKVDRFPPWAWFATVGFVLFDRDFLEFLKDIRK